MKRSSRDERIHVSDQPRSMWRPQPSSDVGIEIEDRDCRVEYMNSAEDLEERCMSLWEVG